MFKLLFFGAAFTFVVAMDQDESWEDSFSSNSNKITNSFTTTCDCPKSKNKGSSTLKKIATTPHEDSIQKHSRIHSQNRFFENQKCRNRKKLQYEDNEESYAILLKYKELEPEDNNHNDFHQTAFEDQSKAKNPKVYIEYEKIQERKPASDIENEGLKSKFYGKNSVRNYNILRRSHVYRVNDNPEKKDKGMNKLFKQFQKLNFFKKNKVKSQKFNAESKYHLNEDEVENLLHD